MAEVEQQEECIFKVLYNCSELDGRLMDSTLQPYKYDVSCSYDEVQSSKANRQLAGTRDVTEGGLSQL